MDANEEMVRLEQIRQLREDLKWVRNARVIANIRDYDTDAKRRTISRLEAELAKLKQGMKEGGKG